MNLSLKCRLYGARTHTPCSGTTDDGTGRPCQHWCHSPVAVTWGACQQTGCFCGCGACRRGSHTCGHNAGCHKQCG